MFRPVASITIVFVLTNVAAAYEPGEQLVIARSADMKVITGSTFQLTAGTPVTVRSSENGKLKVAAPRVGWIDSSAVIPAQDAQGYFAEQVEKSSDKAAAPRYVMQLARPYK